MKLHVVIQPYNEQYNKHHSFYIIDIFEKREKNVDKDASYVERFNLFQIHEMQVKWGNTPWEKKHSMILKSVSMKKIGTVLLIGLTRDPHILKCRKTGKNRPTRPGGVDSLGWC